MNLNDIMLNEVIRCTYGSICIMHFKKLNDILYMVSKRIMKKVWK